MAQMKDRGWPGGLVTRGQRGRNKRWNRAGSTPRRCRLPSKPSHIQYLFRLPSSLLHLLFHHPVSFFLHLDPQNTGFEVLLLSRIEWKASGWYKQELVSKVFIWWRATDVQAEKPLKQSFVALFILPPVWRVNDITLSHQCHHPIWHLAVWLLLGRGDEYKSTLSSSNEIFIGCFELKASLTFSNDCLSLSLERP